MLWEEGWKPGTVRDVRGAVKQGRGWERLSGQGHFENLVPLALQRGDGFQLGKQDGRTGLQSQVRTQEVVEGDKESGEGDRPVAGGKATGRADVVLVSAVEPFDQLLKGPVALREVVEILQAQDLYQGEGRQLRWAVGIEKV